MPDLFPPRSRLCCPPRCSVRPALLALCCLAAVLAACGIPGDPLPPLLEIPEPVRDLSAEQVGARVILQFTPPQLTTEGTRVRSLDRLEILGAFVAPSGAPPDLAVGGVVLATIPPTQIPAGSGHLRYELSLEVSRIGAMAFYAIKAINRRGVDAGLSNVASLEVLDLPGPPTGLTASVTEPAVILSWTPVSQSAFGGGSPEPDGYEIFRAESGSTAAERVGTTESSRFEDRSFQFQHHYVYTLRAFRTQGDSRAATPFSVGVEVDAADRFPPASPQNLRAIAIPGAVEMSWSANAEADLAGYFVYRSSEGARFARLNEHPLELPLFRDSTATAGVSYQYVVRAVDQQGNESAASEEASVIAE